MLHQGQYLLDGNRVRVQEPPNTGTAELQPGMELNYKQKPNRKILGAIKFHLTIYRLGAMFRKTNKVSNFLTNKVGERPVILDSSLCDATVNLIRQYLLNNGYMQAEVSYTVKVFAVKKLIRNAVVTYNVKLGPVYTIKHIDYTVGDTAIALILDEAKDKRLIADGQNFVTSKMVAERQRINDLLKTKGYYLFAPNYISYEWDSTYSKVMLTMLIQNPTDRNHHTAYHFGRVFVEVDTNLVQHAQGDSVVADGVSFMLNGYNVDAHLLRKALNFDSGEMYSQTRVEDTYKALVQLSIFKFVNIRLEPADSLSDRLICHIRLTPQVKQDVSVEPTLQLADQPIANATQQGRNYGISLVTGYTNNNMLGKADIFKLRLRNSLEFQFWENKTTGSKNIYISSENSLNGSLELLGLRFVPFRLAKNNGNLYNRTIFGASLIYEINRDFDRKLAVLSYGYRWNHGNHYYALFPAEVSYIKTDNLSQQLQIYLNTPAGAVLSNLFGKNFIAGSRFVYSYSNQQVRNGKSYFILKSTPLEVAGNLFDLAYGIIDNSKPHNERTIFGVKYFQYIKTDWDVRYNQPLLRRISAVFRLNAACGLPFGNSTIIPYEKRYFSGGSVSLRGWRPRTLGPGGFNDVNNPLNRTGEFKLESNFELRFPIYKKVLEGAFFIDAGNVWNIRHDPLLPDAEININRFKSEIAMDGGIGLRVNLPFFMIRADAAIQMRDPSQPLANRWVGYQNLKDMKTAYNSINWSFGIGYPF